jgi:hypothetical protein
VYGYVPPSGSEAPPAPTDAPPRRKPGPKPKNALQFPPPVPASTPSAFHCQGCARALQPFSLDLADELIRVARDRMLETREPPTVDILFLASRLDGYCSIGCWRQHGATEGQAQQLDKLRGEP